MLQVAGFFINYTMLQALSVIPGDLLRLVPLIVTNIKLKYLAKTQREKDEVVQAGAGTALAYLLRPACCLHVIRAVCVQAPWAGYPLCPCAFS